MLNGFYTAASGMFVQQRNLNVISNNIVNSQTTGFKTGRVMTTTYDQAFMTRLENQNTGHIGTDSPISLVREVKTGMDESSLKETESPFDMAVVGDGYFNIQGENRQYLTRNGNFNIDEQGYLILEGVGRVMGENGPLQVGGSDFSVQNNGMIFNGDGQYVGRLLITAPAENENLTEYNNGLYGGNATQVLNPTVYQNCLERSNIDLNQEYTRVMEAQRAFSSCSSALKIMDQINAKAAGLASIS